MGSKLLVSCGASGRQLLRRGRKHDRDDLSTNGLGRYTAIRRTFGGKLYPTLGQPPALLRPAGIDLCGILCGVRVVRGGDVLAGQAGAAVKIISLLSGEDFCVNTCIDARFC